MSEIGYIVVSEEWYGGSKKRIFRTADAKSDADDYAKKWIAETNGTLDIIVEEIDITNM